MMRTLILGGTGWLGREIALQLVASGDQVTCLARGDSGDVPNGVTFVRSDRREPAAYDQVLDTDWDEVIELSFDAGLVSGALDALAARAQHWTLISSVSVYASNDEPDADEDSLLVEPTEPEDYAHAKVMAERLASKALGDRLLIVRPGLIAGPGDMSDRFSYWVSRLALASSEPVLVPDFHGRFVQFIDVRDLAGWIARGGHENIIGIFNAIGSERELSTVLRAAARVADHTGALVAANDEWLITHDVNYWAGPSSLPLWLPLSDAAFARRSRGRFVSAGGTERSLDQTLEDVLVDERLRGLDRERRSGLTREEEMLLLDELNGLMTNHETSTRGR